IFLGGAASRAFSAHKWVGPRRPDPSEPPGRGLSQLGPPALVTNFEAAHRFAQLQALAFMSDAQALAIGGEPLADLLQAVQLLVLVRLSLVCNGHVSSSRPPTEVTPDFVTNSVKLWQEFHNVWRGEAG